MTGVLWWFIQKIASGKAGIIQLLPHPDTYWLRGSGQSSSPPSGLYTIALHESLDCRLRALEAFVESHGMLCATA